MMRARHKKIEALDWQNARDRLSRAALAYAEKHQLSPEGVRAILDERAHAVAQIPVQAPDADTVIEVVVFTLGDERYAIETTCVREILRFKDFTPVPDTPDFLVGVTNLRGQILAILDVRKIFGVPGQVSSDRSRVMVLGRERVEFGLLAEVVHEIALLRIDEIRETPGSVSAGARDFLRGVTADALLVLDGTILLNDPRLYIDTCDDRTEPFKEKS